MAGNHVLHFDGYQKQPQRNVAQNEAPASSARYIISACWIDSLPYAHSFIVVSLVLHPMLPSGNSRFMSNNGLQMLMVLVLADLDSCVICLRHLLCLLCRILQLCGPVRS